MRRISLRFICLSLALIFLTEAGAEVPAVRVGVLNYGTVNWELEVVQHHELVTRENIDLQIIPYGSANALNVALQGGQVDIVVNDWIWVARQRAAGQNYTSFPYSLSVGSLMVNPDAGIDELADLNNRKLGVAGGPVDKSWLLLRAYSRRELGRDLTDIVEPVFAGAPILSEMMLNGRLPALLNYWQYNARLQAAGMTPLLNVQDLLPALGVEQPVPLLVWVFRENWARQHREQLTGFLNATYAAKQILLESNAEWSRIAPLTRAEDGATLAVLRDTYRAGIPQQFARPEVRAAAAVFDILAEEGGRELVGRATALDDETFWLHYEIEGCCE